MTMTKVVAGIPADGFVARLAEAWGIDSVNVSMDRAHAVAQALTEPAAIVAMGRGWTLDVSEHDDPRIVSEDDEEADDWDEACDLEGAEVPAGAHVAHVVVDEAIARGALSEGHVATELCGLWVVSRLVVPEAG